MLMEAFIDRVYTKMMNFSMRRKLNLKFKQTFQTMPTPMGILGNVIVVTLNMVMPV